MSIARGVPDICPFGVRESQSGPETFARDVVSPSKSVTAIVAARLLPEWPRICLVITVGAEFEVNIPSQPELVVVSLPLPPEQADAINATETSLTLFDTAHLRVCFVHSARHPDIFAGRRIGDLRRRMELALASALTTNAEFSALS